MMLIKQVGNRFYRWSWRQARSFPIAKKEALKLLEAGEAEFVKGWYYEQPEPGKSRRCKRKNVVSLADARAKKQEQAKLEEAKAHFVEEVLPNLSQESLLRLVRAAESGSKEEYQAEIMRCLMESAARKA